ncbi:MAG: DUF3794 domain-containing protein [Firmicutes bacterium]|nr:DUF3794 domain-containing protein [Bacillota bacterium]MCL5040555.1 DUF3794 domain-containing protein [Bacillota bacterium]
MASDQVAPIRPILQEVVLGQALEQGLADKIFHLSEPAQALRGVTITFRQARGSVLEGKVIAEATLEVDILYLGEDSLLIYQREDMSIRLLMTIPVARPGMQARVEFRKENLTPELMGQDLRVKVVFLVECWVLQEELSTEAVPWRVYLDGRRFFGLPPITLETGPYYVASPAVEVGELDTCTCFVANLGNASALVRLDYSPDQSIWEADRYEETIAPTSNLILVPKYYLRHLRLSCRSALPAAPTRLRIWFQGRV